MKRIIEKDVEIIGKPSDYCEWYGEPEYKNIKKIIVSCGGGMGGSIWEEYVENFDDENLDKFIKVYSIEKEKDLILNSNFIVSIEEKTLVTCTFKYEASNGDRIENRYILIELNKKIEKSEDETYYLFNR